MIQENKECVGEGRYIHNFSEEIIPGKKHKAGWYFSDELWNGMLFGPYPDEASCKEALNKHIIQLQE